jgi:hypothetical protein
MKPVIDVISHRRQINPELAAWLEAVRRSHPVRTIYSQYDLPLARRQSLANFIAKDVPAGYTHLVQLDDDLVPVPTTEHILVEPGDLVYCGIAGRSGKWGHYGDGDFGAACCRISAKLAADLEVATRFDYGFNADRTEMVRCECQVFNDQARRLGYTSRMVGAVGHCVPMTVFPGPVFVLDRDIASPGGALPFLPSPRDGRHGIKAQQAQRRRPGNRGQHLP